MTTPRGRLDLGRRLARQLFPVAVAIVALISAGFPVGYYFLDLDHMRHMASRYAQGLADRLETILLERPDLWKYQATTYQQILGEFLSGKQVTAVRVLDVAGRPVPAYAYAPVAGGAWSVFTVTGRHPLVFNNRQLGGVEVAVSLVPLLQTTLALFLLLSILGVGLAVVIYQFPVRVVTGMEGQIQSLIETVERSNAELAALVKANQVLTSSLKLEEILQAIVRQAAAISEVAAVRLFLLDEETQVLRCRVGIGLTPGLEENLVVPVGQSFSGQVAATGEPLAVADCRGDPRLLHPEHATKHGLISYLGLPVKVGGRLFGVLVFNSDAPHTYTPEETSLLSAFARQAAIAIENARLYQQAQAHAEVLEQKVAERTQALAAAQLQLVQSEKLASVGTLAAGVAHELNQPLMVIRGYAQELLEDERITDAEIREDLRRIEAQTTRMGAIINHLRDFSRQSKGKRQETDLNRVVAQAFTFVGQQLKLRNITVVQDLEPTLPPVWGDPLQLEQVLLNLVTNAGDAMAPGGTGTLTVRTYQNAEGRTQKADEPKQGMGAAASLPTAACLLPSVVLEVEDTGPGIPPEVQARIFDPFFTTKDVGKGTGLGLSICYGIIQEHGGEIRVESPVAEGRGTRFTVVLPFTGPSDKGTGA